MSTLTLFIASSAELKDDREAFREMLSIENDRLSDKGIYLKLVQWEFFLNAVSQTGKQADYNEAITTSDIVVCLFYTKAGKYTQEEFDTALKTFKETGKPLIYTYFKESLSSGLPAPTADETEADKISREQLVAFKKRLSDLGHFYTRYKNTEDLKYQFLQQLEMLKEKGYINLKEEVKQSSEAAVEKYLQTVNTVNKTVNNNFNIGSQQGDIKNFGNIENATFN